MKNVCVFTAAYKKLEQERFRIVKLLQGQGGPTGQQGFIL